MMKQTIGTSLKYLVMGLWMVLLALGLRLAEAAVPQSLPAPDAGRFCRLAGECLRPGSVTEETASQEVHRPERPPIDTRDAQEQPAAEEPEISRLCFSGQEADAIAIGGSAQSAVDKASLLLAPLTLSGNDSPQVLIVHTHTSEAYTPEPGQEYEPTAEFRTLDANYNVVRVGDELAQALESLGVGVVHDPAVNDDPVYEGAYERSFDRIEAQLAAHPTIDIVLDIHRDALEDAEGNALPRRTQVDGENCAQLMLVVGTDEGGLYHPNWQENLSFALKLQALLNREYPGLCRDISLRRERYNQHFTPGSLLVEVGAAGNTLDEALRSARCLADAVAQLIMAASES